jgi:hypothetical protein
MSLDVRTTGLPPVDAQHYATLLKFAAGAGQTPGLGLGQLPPGFLPMTEGNGMRAQVEYTRDAAAAVAAQSGAVPDLVPAPTVTTDPAGAPDAAAPTPPTGTEVPAVATGAAVAAAEASSTGASATVGGLRRTVSAASAPPGSPSAAAQQVAAGPRSAALAAKTVGLRPGLAGLALLFALLLAPLGGLSAAVTLFVGRRRRMRP